MLQVNTYIVDIGKNIDKHMIRSIPNQLQIWNAHWRHGICAINFKDLSASFISRTKQAENMETLPLEGEYLIPPRLVGDTEAEW
jgi:hypothetical protein